MTIKYNTCSSCAYWFKYSEGGSGECRRHAPAPMYSMAGDKPGPIWWPQTMDYFWCGDWKQKADAAVDTLDLSIDELKLSVRAHNGLNNDYCNTIGDVVKRSRGDLLRLPNFGKQSLKDVEEALARHNLQLSETPLETSRLEPY